MRRLGLGLFLLASVATGKSRRCSLFELVGWADIVVHGRVVEVRKDTAVVAVIRTWKQEAGATRITVEPITLRYCVRITRNFAVSDEVVLFLKSPANAHYRVLAAGQGKRAISKARSAELFAAVDRLVKIARLSEDATNRAMLALATASNGTLRHEAHLHIRLHTSHSKLRANYRSSMVALLKEADPETRRAALAGLRHVKAPEAIDSIVTLTRDPDLGIVQEASLALSHYDTPTTVAALLALTRHDNEHVRQRAMIDLSSSRSDVAKRGLVALLVHDDADIRGQAWTTLRDWVKELRRTARDHPDEVIRAQAASYVELLSGRSHERR